MPVQGRATSGTGGGGRLASAAAHTMLPIPASLEIAWGLLMLASLTFEVRTAEQSLAGQLDTTYLLRFVYVCLALGIILFNLQRVPRFRASPVSIFLLYTMFCVLSSLWSIGRVATFGKAVELMAAALVVWITAATSDRIVRLQRLMTLTITIACALLLYVSIGAIIFPADFWEPSAGIFPYLLTSPQIHSNSISQYGALVGLIMIAKALQSQSKGRKIVYVAVYLATFAFPILAQGRTGMISLTVGTVLILLRARPYQTLILIPLVGGLVFTFFGDALVALFLRGQDEEMLLSLSGRTTWWGWGWAAFLEHPFAGSGFGVGGRNVFLTNAAVSDTTSSTHNGLLEVLLGVGLAGFAIWCASFLWSFVLVGAAYIAGRRLDVLAGWVVVLTATILSVGAGGWMDMIVAYLLLSSGILWEERQRMRIARQRKGARATQMGLQSARLRLGW
jgi:O-antigen ligase